MNVKHSAVRQFARRTINNKRSTGKMKIKKSSLMAMIALGSAVAFAPLARAETSDAKPTRVAARKAGAHDRLQHIADVLQLTDDQKAKVKPIFQDEAQKMKA